MTRRTAYAAVFKSGRMHPTLSFHGYDLDLSRLKREAEADAASDELPVEIVPVKIEMATPKTANPKDRRCNR